MARTRTRAQIRQQARDEADVGTDYVSNDMANTWIDQAVARLWSMLVAADPLRYSTTTSVSTTTGTVAYTLPSDFMAIVSVWLMSGTQRYPVDPFQEHERAIGPPFSINSLGETSTRYRVIEQGLTGSATRLQFDPDPGTNTYEVRYVQAPQLLAADVSTIDGVAGWEDWIVYEVAIKMRNREQTDASALVMEREKIEREIQAMAAKRDAGRPGRIQDVRDRAWSL